MVTKKKCSKCGRTWGIAKRMCTCGNTLAKTKVSSKPKVDRKCPLKQCSTCGEYWATNQRMCTCDNDMICDVSKNKKSTKRKRVYNCSTCGQVKGIGHVCPKKPSRMLPDRVAKKKSSSLDEICADVPHATQSDKTPLRPKIRRPLCGVCKLRNKLSTFSKQCISKSVQQAKTDLAVIEQQDASQFQQLRVWPSVIGSRQATGSSTSSKTSTSFSRFPHI